MENPEKNTIKQNKWILSDIVGWTITIIVFIMILLAMLTGDDGN